MENNRKQQEENAEKLSFFDFYNSTALLRKLDKFERIKVIFPDFIAKNVQGGGEHPPSTGRVKQLKIGFQALKSSSISF